jgi:hypothetical protein
MHDTNKFARRYHWLGESVNDFVCEPHHAIDDLKDKSADAVDAVDAVDAIAAGQRTRGSSDRTRDLPSQESSGQLLLNMVASEADANRNSSVDLVGWNPDKLLFEARRMTSDDAPSLFAPTNHEVLPKDVNLDRLERIVRDVHEAHPQDFTTLLGAKGVGPATVRALSLLAELIYDAPASHRDPAASRKPAPEKLPPVLEHLRDRNWADYSYAHGGKDGTPHPVDRATYDTSINVLTDAVRKARVGNVEKSDALKRLAQLHRT